MDSLFGENIPDSPPKKIQGVFNIWKHSNGYSKDKKNKCQDCVHLTYIHGNLKTYYKCKLMGISNSEASDIRLKHGCNLQTQGLNTNR